LGTAELLAVAVAWAAGTQAVVQCQFGNLLAVTVYVQDLTATWVVVANYGKFVTQQVQAAVVVVTLQCLCNVVAGKVTVSCTHGKAAAVA
jgi:hypothetical protein